MNEKEKCTRAMANMLNGFFVNIAQNLNIVFDKNSANSFDSSKLQQFVSSTIGNFVTQFNIPQITMRKTQKLIENLSSSKAMGADKLSVFVQPLTQLINLSIQKSHFPSKWKLACVTPLFKDGGHNICDNFRPILVLPYCQKFLKSMLLPLTWTTL